MKLDRFLMGSGMGFNDDPRMPVWARKWLQPFDSEAYDTISIGKDCMEEMLPQIETMNFSGSDLLLQPSLREFRLCIHADGFANTIVFRKSFLPERYKQDGDKEKTLLTPVLDAYVFFHGSKTPDLIINIGIWRLMAGERDITGTYQQIVWAAFDESFIDADLIEHTRMYKFAYMLMQKALYERPVLFRTATIPHSVTKAGKKRNNKAKRIVKMVKVMQIHNDEFEEYIKAQRSMTCPCWGVIGHWRTYKSGKQVWINPYKKGRLRHDPTAYSPKDYTLPKEETT